MKFFWFFLFFVSTACSDDMTWSNPVQISTNGYDCLNPQIAMDANGNSTAVWIEGIYLRAKSKAVNGSWGSSSTLSSSSPTTPILLMDPNGNTTALWIESGFVKACSKTILGSWGIASTLSLSGATSLQAAVDSIGNIVAAWARNGNIETSTKLLNGLWLLYSTISSTNADLPFVAISSNGTAFLIWQALVNSTYTIYTSRALLGAVWSTPQAISNSGQNSGYPKIGADAQGNAVALWYAFNLSGVVYSSVTVQASSYASSWSTPVNLSNGGYRNPSELMLCLKTDAKSDWMALWNNSYDGASYTVECAVKQSGGSWTSSAIVVGSNFHSCSLDCSVQSTGHALAFYIFYDPDTSSFVVQASETDIGGLRPNFWSFPMKVQTNAVNGYGRIASAMNGINTYADAVWIHYGGSNNIVQNSTASGTTTQSPTNLAVTQGVTHYGIFDEYYNTLTWSPSPSSDIRSYLIYRNGFYLIEVDANTFSYVDHNRHQNESVTYGVAAIDDELSQSPIATVSFP